MSNRGGNKVMRYSCHRRGHQELSVYQDTYHSVNHVLGLRKIICTVDRYQVRAILLGWPGLIGKCRSIFLGYSHWSLTGRFGVSGSTPHVIFPFSGFFWLSRLAKRDSRLAARGSRLAARGSGLAARGSGLGARGSGLGARGSGLGARGSGLGARGSGLGARGSGLGARGSGLGARGSGLGAQGSGFAVCEVSMGKKRSP